MYDRILYKGEIWQTKDLDNLLEFYEITNDGKLKKATHDWITLDDLDSPVNSRTELTRRVVVGATDYNYTGTLELIAEEDIPGRPENYEIVVYMENGQLIREMNREDWLNAS